MTDFDYDAMQKKRNARGAFNRKRGSKSRKCSLPSDYLTEKQLKELNGKVNTYYMNKPMSWEHFKTASEQIQTEYIDHLVSEYNVGKSDIAKMFGICVQTLDARLKALQLKSQFKTGSRKSHEQKAMWVAFVTGLSERETEDKNSFAPAVESSDMEFASAGKPNGSDGDADLATQITDTSAEKEMADNEPCDCVEEKPACKMHMRKFTLTFEGLVDADAIANSIRSIAGKGACGIVEIKCEF